MTCPYDFKAAKTNAKVTASKMTAIDFVTGENIILLYRVSLISSFRLTGTDATPVAEAQVIQALKANEQISEAKVTIL